MHIFTRAAGCAAMGLFVVACGNGPEVSATTTAGAATGSTGSSGDAAVDVVDMFCKTLAKPYCEASHIFQVSPSTGADRTIESCVELVYAGTPLPICTHDFERAGLEASLRAGLTVFDQAQFDTCLDILKTMSVVGAGFTEPPLTVFETTCLRAFQGQGAPGAACPFKKTFGIYLADPTALPCKDGRCEDGTCVPFLKPGDACDIATATDYYLRRDATATMLCNYSNSEVCVKTPGAEADAGAGGSGPVWTCRPRAELGEACVLKGDGCDCRSLHCDRMTGTCAPPDGGGGFCKEL